MSQNYIIHSQSEEKKPILHQEELYLNISVYQIYLTLCDSFIFPILTPQNGRVWGRGGVGILLLSNLYTHQRGAWTYNPETKGHMLSEPARHPQNGSAF